MSPRLRNFLIFLLAAIGPFLSAQAQTPDSPSTVSSSSLIEPKEGPPEEVIFSFVQGFPEAHTDRRKWGRIVQGLKIENGFRFEDSPPGATDVFVSPDVMVNGKPRQAISLLIVPGFETNLIFQNIPPGRRLRFFYALPDTLFQTANKAAVSFVQVEVLIGRKVLFEGQTNTKGWREKAVDLTLPYLLHRELQVTIRTRSLDPAPQFLVFYGAIE